MHAWHKVAAHHTCSARPSKQPSRSRTGLAGGAQLPVFRYCSWPRSEPDHCTAAMIVTQTCIARASLCGRRALRLASVRAHASQPAADAGTRLQGKTCVVQGASRGLGREFVRQLLAIPDTKCVAGAWPRCTPAPRRTIAGSKGNPHDAVPWLQCDRHMPAASSSGAAAGVACAVRQAAAGAVLRAARPWACSQPVAAGAEARRRCG